MHHARFLALLDFLIGSISSFFAFPYVIYVSPHTAPTRSMA